ncbi:hypothetical protein C9975_09780, partial [Thalassospira xiamenensis]
MREFSYDAQGNLIEDIDFDGSVLNYTYNDENRMTQAGSTLYKYNALGQRVEKRMGSTRTHFVCNRQGQLLSEGTQKQYIYFDG